jgi:hypothetical protein
VPRREPFSRDGRTWRGPQLGRVSGDLVLEPHGEQAYFGDKAADARGLGGHRLTTGTGSAATKPARVFLFAYDGGRGHLESKP